MGTNLGFSHRVFNRHCGVLYAIHTTAAPSEAEWMGYLNELSQLRAQLAEPSAVRGLTLTDGGAPNAGQRRRLVQTAGEAAIRASIVTDSALVRGAVTALSWVKQGPRAYPPARFDDALANLELPPSAAKSIIEDLLAIQHTMAPVSTARAIVEAQAAHRQERSD